MALEKKINQHFLPFLKTTKFLFAVKPDCSDSRESVILSTEMVRKHGDTLDSDPIATQHDIVIAYLKALLGESYSDDHPIHKNFGMATYENYKLVFFGKPIICKYEDKIQLIIGAESRDLGLAYTTIPLVFSPSGISLQGSAITYLEIEAEEVTDPDNSNEKIKIPILVFSVTVNDKKYVMAVNIRLSPDVSYHDFKEAWKTKDVMLLNSMVGGLYGASCSISYMFQEHFKGGTFPSSGVVLKVTGARVNERIKESSDGSKRVLKSVLYSVDCSKLPAVNVTTTQEANTGIAPLNEVTGVFFNRETHDAGIAYDANNLPTPEEPHYIYIMGKGRASNQVPAHQIFTTHVPQSIMAIAARMNQPNYFLTAEQF